MTLADALEWRYGYVADTAGDRITAWRHPTLPAPTDLVSLMADYETHLLHVAAKGEAFRQIVSAFPEWKQRNMIARGVVLNDKGQANHTPDEAAEATELRNAWTWIESVRTFSDQVESDIDDGTINSEEEIRTAPWPARPIALR